MDKDGIKEVKHEKDPRFVTWYYVALGIGTAYLAVLFIGSLW